MGDLIKSKNSDFGEYEELLIERDSVRKEALYYKEEYMRIFGDLIVETFEVKVSCIKKKKIISYCQARINRGESIDNDEMNLFIEEQMLEYNKQLNDMIEENNNLKDYVRLSKDTVTKIKKLYHKLAKMLHPDINPETLKHEELMALWNMIVVSYENNSLDDLMDAELLVNRALENLGLDSIDVEIPDIAEKIKKVKDEILDIKSNNPYQYKFLLENSEAMAKKEEELKKELDEYISYEKELDGILDDLLSEGGSFKWVLK